MLRALKRLITGGPSSGGGDSGMGEGASLPVPNWIDDDLEEDSVKARLFLSPRGDVPSLFEVVLPDGRGAEPAVMRCFSPPPEGGGAQDPDLPRRAWTVELDAGEVENLQELARGMSLFPMGRPVPHEDEATVELSLAAGQAEARIRWWMSPPEEWTGVDRFVARLRELAGSPS